MRPFRIAVVVVAALVATLGGPAQARSATSEGHGTAAAAPTAGGAPRATDKPAATPVLAYYYIWFDRSSWNRAKSDLPLLGKYSSDDPHVIREHIRAAKAAGIQGFIVSWKHTPILDRRLAQLIDIAESENFKLGIIYQGLDFSRNPLPVDRVSTDIDYFATTFASREAFQIPTFSKPLVIWSGTWMFDRNDIARVTTAHRDQLLLLASERSLDGYERLADVVDGDAYYWSSVNPATYPGYLAKLTEMGRAVHRNHGIWIPPAAPGFDARMVGGTTVVGRDHGKTLRTEVATALAASPSALGLISWNEFSENSHLEPSAKYGSHYLDVLRAALRDSPHAPSPAVRASNVDVTDSSSSGTSGFPTAIPALSGFFLLFGGSVVLLAGRQRRRRERGDRGPRDGPGSGGGGTPPRDPDPTPPRHGRGRPGSADHQPIGGPDDGASRTPELMPIARMQGQAIAHVAGRCGDA